MTRIGRWQALREKIILASDTRTDLKISAEEAALLAEFIRYGRID